MEQYISTREAEELTGYRAAWIRELVKRKKVEAKKFGQTLMIDRKSLLDYKKEADAKK